MDLLRYDTQKNHNEDTAVVGGGHGARFFLVCCRGGGGHARFPWVPILVNEKKKAHLRRIELVLPVEQRVRRGRGQRPQDRVALGHRFFPSQRGAALPAARAANLEDQALGQRCKRLHLVFRHAGLEVEVDPGHAEDGRAEGD